MAWMVMPSKSVALCSLLVLVTLVTSSVQQSRSDGSSEAHNPRFKRLAQWEHTIDAIKCTLKIVAKQVASYHNNRLMCCGLWYMKDLLISKSLSACDKPNETSIVFKETINEQLIYSDFSKSLLGDQDLNCQDYEEGSSACEWLYKLIFIFFILVVFTIFFITFGFIISISQWYRWKRNYRILLTEALIDAGDNETAPWATKGRRRLEKSGSMQRMYKLVEQPRQKVRNMMNYLEHKGNVMTGKVEAPRVTKPRPHGRRSVGSRDSIHSATDANNVRRADGSSTLIEVVDSRVDIAATPTTDGGRCSSSASTESSTITSEGNNGSSNV